MAVGFGIVAFSVYTDGELPQPEAGEGGVLTWSASLKIASSANMESLRNYLTIVTVRPALGLVNQGMALIEAGPGIRSLTIPEGNGATRQYDAVLTSFAARSRLLTDEAWTVDASFLLLEETTP